MFQDSKLYEEAYDQAVRKNEETIAVIEQFKKELEGVKETLKENQKHLFQHIMAPLAGGKALMKAKLVRTNDVMVFLGDKWFVRTSSARAIEICNRKITRCNENKAEIELLTDRFRSNLEKVQEYEPFSSVDVREIVEPYDEEAEKLWKEKHREKVREFKKQEAAERNKFNDEDIFKKLNKMDKEDDNFNSNETIEETDSDSSSEDDDSDTANIDTDVQSSNSNGFYISSNLPSMQSSHPFGFPQRSDVNLMKLHEISSNFNSIEDNDMSSSTLRKSDSFESMDHPNVSCIENTTQNQSAPKKRVSFSTTDELKCYSPVESDDETNIIWFKHSDASPSPTTHKTDRIESPNDIYEMIVQGFNPKSILKKGTQHFPENISQPTETELSKLRHNTVYAGYSPPEEVVIGDISEKNPVVVSKIDTTSRKPSQFRKARNTLTIK